jgi:SAM-dependent methyltransferase
MSELNSFLVIDEDGDPLGQGADQEVRLPANSGREALQNIKISETGAFETEVADERMLVEAFDEPFVAKSLIPTNANIWQMVLPYGVEKSFKLDTLCVDEWDRFHGLTLEEIPFVLSPAAQNQLFDLCDNFDDDSLTYKGVEYKLQPWLFAKENVGADSFWNQIYEKNAAGWDLGGPSPVLIDMIPRLKIPKARVLVLGCGAGHDAAFLAEHDHFVTAVDFSAEAIAQAKKKYAQLKNLKFEQHDIFKLPTEWTGQFDVIFEHTCYCAINPERRNEVVKIWRRMLSPQGSILAVFFTMYNNHSPPFGSSEWEIRKRLQPFFHFIFWGRWRQSITRRQGQELVVYAQKKDLEK